MTIQTPVLYAPSVPMTTTPLRPAVLAEASALSSEARREIMAMSGARPARFAGELVFTWASIAAFIAAGVYFDSIAITLISIFLIGTRQMALALLLHEQVHRLGMRSKYADWVINLSVGYPLFVTTVEDYAKVHLSHHKYCFTQDDPDFLRKAGDEWTFPKSAGQLFMIALKDLTAMNLIRLIRGKTAPRTDEFERRNPSPKWLRYAFFAVVGAVLTAIGGWTTFLIYWVVPAITVSQLMIRWIAVCEHQYNIENGTIHETTPLIQLTWWQRALMPDLNFGLHAYHHMHPGVSFSNLPKVHEIYKREGLVDESAIFHGQGAYLKYLMGAK
ncbi:MAG: fatty acid desaturase [Telluria sp.]